MVSSASVLISVDGIPLGGVEKYRVLAKREGNVDGSIGDSGSASVSVGAKSYRVELEKLVLPAPVSDGISFLELDKCSVSIQRPGSVVTYSGCRWIEVAERCDLTSHVVERAVFLATKRVETSTLSEIE